MLQLLTGEFRIILQDVLAFVLLFAAFVWGGGPERAVAATWVLVFKIPSLIRRFVLPVPFELDDVDFLIASSDVLAGIIFITIALYANRNYTLWVAAMQLLAMSAHLARGLVESILPIGYIVMTVAPGWFQLIFLAIGIFRHVRRKAEHGPYRDWRRAVSASAGLSPPAAHDASERIVLKGANASWRDDLK